MATLETGSAPTNSEYTKSNTDTHPLESLTSGQSEEANAPARDSSPASDYQDHEDLADKRPPDRGLVLGGTFGELKNAHGGYLAADNKEVHHIPPWNATWEDERMGLAIVMDKEDHKRLDTTGASYKALALHEEYHQQLDRGEWKKVIEAEIAEIQTKSGDKYDEHLRQMLDTAERQGKI